MPPVVALPSQRKRRRQEATALHRIVRTHIKTAFVEAAERTGGSGYPSFVEDEFLRYLRCGVFAHGFVRAHCDTCGQSELVAFSCKGRAVCPSCTGRRMADTTLHLVDHVMPSARYRQWTLSFPWRIRVLLVRHPALVTALGRVMLQRIARYQRKYARDLCAIRDDPVPKRMYTASVLATQRFGSRLNLHVHFHAVIPDAVWVPRPDGSLVPIHLPPPCDDDVVAIATDIAKRALAVVEKYGDAEADDTDDTTADTAQLMLANLAKRHREESPRNDKPRRLSAFAFGFSLECAPSAEPSDRKAWPRFARNPNLRQILRSCDTSKPVIRLVGRSTSPAVASDSPENRFCLSYASLAAEVLCDHLENHLVGQRISKREREVAATELARVIRQFLG